MLLFSIALKEVPLWSKFRASVLLSGSWVELEELIAAVSRRESLTGLEDSVSSSLQGELERILLEAQLECERSRERYRFKELGATQGNYHMFCELGGFLLSK